jgi:hypothetical protein
MGFSPRLLLSLGLAVAAACGGDDDGAPPDGTVATIEIRPGGQLLTPERQTAKLEAVALDADGNEVAATFTWTSSTPDQIAVDANGNVSAVSELGSATIVASADDVSSNPAVVATVALHPGTVVVTDENVVEVGTPFLPDGADETDFPLMDVRLRGIDPPAEGTIVVSAESSALGGSVVSAENDGGEVAVRLQLVSMPELFARYEIDWQIPLEGYGVEESDEEVSAREIAAAFLPIEQRLKKEWPTRGPFRCSGSIAAYLEKNTVDLKLGGDAEFIFKSSRSDASLPPGYLKVAIEGPFTLKGSLALRAKAGLEATGKCELKGRIPIALGPFAIVVSPAIPLGVGVKLKAKVKLATLELGFEGENGFDLGLGFECGPGTAPCHSLDKVDWISNFKPLLEVPRGMKDTRVEMSAQAYFLTGVDLLFGLGTWTFEAFEVTVGPIQAADLGFVDNQMADRGYASKYDLKLEGKAGAGGSVDTALKKLLGKDEEDASLGLEVSISKPLSRSPIGTHTADKTSLTNGEKVRFSVMLDESTVEYFLIGHNAKSIEFYRKKEDSPLYEHMKSVEVTGSNQAIVWDWTPTSEDTGKNEIFAFVKTALPVIELEVAVDSGKKVEVVGICGGGGTPTPPGALPGGGGDSGCEVNGTLSYTFVQQTPTGAITTTSTATVQLQHDEEGSTPGLLVFRPYGSWSATHSGGTDGCTVSTAPNPMTGTVAGDPTQGVFMIDTGDFGTQKFHYHGAMTTGAFPVSVTLDCPPADPYTTEQNYDINLWNVLFTDSYVLDEDTLRATDSYTETIDSGNGYSQTTTYTWDLQLTMPEEDPPPPPPLK